MDSNTYEFELEGWQKAYDTFINDTTIFPGEIKGEGYIFYKEDKLGLFNDAWRLFEIFSEDLTSSTRWEFTFDVAVLFIIIYLISLLQIVVLVLLKFGVIPLKKIANLKHQIVVL